MKLVKLQLEGFMGFRGKVELVLDDLGLVHIAGVNLDDPGSNSNGAAKTTILEGLTWVLFGEGLPRPKGDKEQGVRADEVLNDQLRKQCYGSVDLEDEDQVHFQVERWRKYKNADGPRSSGVRLKIGDDAGPWEDTEALDEKETNRLICQQLGLDRDIWCRGIIFGQESAFNFCEATAKSRTEILTTVMGVEILDTWLNNCRDEKRALTTKMAEVGGKLEILAAERDRLAAEDGTVRVNEWELQRAGRVSYQQTHVAGIEAQGKELAAKLAACPQPPPLPDPLTFRVPEELVLEEQRSRAALTEQRLAHTRVERDLRYAHGQLSAADFNGLPVCQTCLQPITDQHKESCRAEAQKMIDSTQVLFQEAVVVLGQRSAEVAAVTQQLAAAQQQADAALREHGSRTAAREQVMRGRGQIEQQIAAARSSWQREHGQIALIEAEGNPHLAYQAELEQRRAQNFSALSLAMVEQAEIGQALDIALWWEKELPRFRTWLFDAVVDTLAAEANRWLRIMSGGVMWVQISTTKQVGKRLKDELDVQVYRWQPDGSVTTRSYRTWSGGEKRKIVLAVDLGLSRLMADRASKAYKFAALDEVDRHLDAKGREGLRQVLEELRREKETLLTITHDAEFRASFDTEILVTKENGISRLETRDAQRESHQAVR